MYYIVTVPFHPTRNETITSDWFALGALGIQELSDRWQVFFSDDWDRKRLRETFEIWYPGDQLNIDDAEDENWMENWKQYFKPVSIPPYTILPTWESVPSQSMPIWIEPKMAFGTGTHETTQLVAGELPTIVTAGDQVLDIGTGSGILAIIAEKCGADSVMALDIDPIAIENAQENCELNQCERITLLTGSLADVNDTFNVILANVNAVVLRELADVIIDRIAPGGTLLLSGILHGDTDLIKDAYEPLRHIKTVKKSEWALMAFQN